MAATINIPFNFQPATGPTVKTASYTIPAGRFARVRFLFSSIRNISYVTGAGGVPLPTQTFTAAICSVNGVEVLKERAIFLDVTAIPFGNSPRVFNMNTPNFGGSIEGYVYPDAVPSATGSFSVNNLSYSNFNTPIYQSFTETFTFISSNQYSTRFKGLITNHSTPEYIDLWLKEGDVINGTGNWRAVVVEYLKAV